MVVRIARAKLINFYMLYAYLHRTLFDHCIFIVADPAGSGAFLTPGAGIRDGKKVGIRIRGEQPGSYFRELRIPFFGLKYLNSLMRIRDAKIGIRDPG